MSHRNDKCYFCSKIIPNDKYHERVWTRTHKYCEEVDDKPLDVSKFKKDKHVYELL